MERFWKFVMDDFVHFDFEQIVGGLLFDFIGIDSRIAAISSLKVTIIHLKKAPVWRVFSWS